MKQLDKCVNVIPVISKADTLTLEERESFKKRVSVSYTSYASYTLSLDWVYWLLVLFLVWFLYDLYITIIIDILFQIREDIHFNNITIYPVLHNDLTDDEMKVNNKIKVINSKHWTPF